MEKMTPEQRADQFIRDEKQFQLGFLKKFFSFYAYFF